MTTSMRITRRPWAGLLAAGILAAATPAFGAPTTVQGLDDPALDRANIQAAIDAADDGDTIVLDGTFQLDGGAIAIGRGLRLRGKTLDNDGDGVVNEDWIDGADNDGDGLVDEDGWDAHIVGLVDENGLPLSEIDRTTVFNRAIFVRGLEDTIEDLRITDIRFSGHFRAITLEPDTGSTGGTVCENLFSTAGSLSDPRVERNRFDNNDRAVELEGATEDARIKNNLIEDSAISIIVQGLGMGCPLIGGGFDRFPTGQPIETRVEGNRIPSNRSIGVFNSGSIATRIKDNTIANGSLGIFSDNDPEVEIKANVLDQVRFAIDVFDPTDDGQIKDNTINGTIIGVLLDLDASGWVVKDNIFGPSLFANVFLETSSSDNRVILDEGDTVFDLGTDNTIIVE